MLMIPTTQTDRMTALILSQRLRNKIVKPSIVHIVYATRPEHPRGYTNSRSLQPNCHRGHKLSGANLIISKEGTRVCRECKRLIQQAYKARLAAAQV